LALKFDKEVFSKFANFYGKKYRRVKTFRDEKKADKLLKELEAKYPSKRTPPIIERMPIGLGLGNLYRVYVPVGE
jgi:hypothetical protein